MTEKARDSTIKKIIELSQMKDEKDSQRIGRLRTSKNGKWIEGLNENSTNWTHQWKGRGSQPGTGLKETSQFMIAKSTDDGLSWGFPDNITSKTKRPEWVAKLLPYLYYDEEQYLYFPANHEDNHSGHQKWPIKCLYY